MAGFVQFNERWSVRWMSSVPGPPVLNCSGVYVLVMVPEKYLDKNESGVSTWARHGLRRR